MRVLREMSRLSLAAMLAAGVSLGALATGADAKTFRYANDGDANTMDPYGRNETFLLTFTQNIYDPLIRRDKNLKLEPALALTWTQTEPTVWRFTLRRGVKYHDGADFNADDVVFSWQRAVGPGSNMNGVFASVKEVRKVDDFTVEMVTNGPNPILPEELTTLAMMDKEWCEKHNATRAADLTKNEESYATRNANGTGPFMLKSREADVRTVLVPNPNWWDKAEHNLTEVIFSRIGNDATRIAALLSGEVDMVYTVPTQDTDRIAANPNLKVIQGPELRTIYLGFDQMRDELQESSVKGKNPFKDRRVREAFYKAIDIEAIKTRVMRNLGTPTALMIGAGVNGFDPALNVRPKMDQDAARKLLAEAGYPTGFEVGMDCPNDRYVQDEQICQAITAMLARIGIKVNLLAQTRAKYFAKINPPGYNTSFYLLGWTPATYDAHNMIVNLAYTQGGTKGAFNNGRFSNKRVDELSDLIQSETDQAKRNAHIKEALTIIKEEYLYIPLHQQVIVWAAKKNIDLVQQADNYFPLRFVKVN